MPTVFDATFRALAKKLVAKFGVSTGIYTKITHGTMNDNTNKVEGSTTNAQPLIMSPPVRYEQSEINGTTIKYDDFKIYITAPDFEDVFGASVKVEPEDILEVNGITLRIIEPNPIYSGEQVAVYKIQVRKGQESAF